jgi:hypothetical protein
MYALSRKKRADTHAASLCAGCLTTGAKGRLALFGCDSDYHGERYCLTCRTGDHSTEVISNEVE